MEIASQEDPIPVNTSYGINGGGNMIHHLHHHHANSAPSSLNNTTPNPLLVSSNGIGLGKNHDYSHHHHHVGYNIMVSNNNIKKEKPVVIKYKECLKNHAASMGGNAIDGCGEFMPSGEEGSIEALTCSACNCHRNFHRREIEGEETISRSPTAPVKKGDLSLDQESMEMKNQEAGKMCQNDSEQNGEVVRLVTGSDINRPNRNVQKPSNRNVQKSSNTSQLPQRSSTPVQTNKTTAKTGKNKGSAKVECTEPIMLTNRFDCLSSCD